MAAAGRGDPAKNSLRQTPRNDVLCCLGAPFSETRPLFPWLQVHSVLQDAGLLRGLVGALVRQRDTRAFTAAARALFPVRNQPPVPDTTVPWPAPRHEGAHPRSSSSLRYCI